MNLMQQLFEKKDELIVTDATLQITIEYTIWPKNEERLPIAEEDITSENMDDVQATITLDAVNNNGFGIKRMYFVPLSPSRRDKSGWTTIVLPSLATLGIDAGNLEESCVSGVFSFKMVSNALKDDRIVGDKVYKSDAMEFFAYSDSSPSFMDEDIDALPDDDDDDWEDQPTPDDQPF